MPPANAKSNKTRSDELPPLSPRSRNKINSSMFSPEDDDSVQSSKPRASALLKKSTGGGRASKQLQQHGADEDAENNNNSVPKPRGSLLRNSTAAKQQLDAIEQALYHTPMVGGSVSAQSSAATYQYDEEEGDYQEPEEQDQQEGQEEEDNDDAALSPSSRLSTVPGWSNVRPQQSGGTLTVNSHHRHVSAMMGRASSQQQQQQNLDPQISRALEFSARDSSASYQRGSWFGGALTRREVMLLSAVFVLAVGMLWMWWMGRHNQRPPAMLGM